MSSAMFSEHIITFPTNDNLSVVLVEWPNGEFA
jgi:hypothetical protein